MTLTLLVLSMGGCAWESQDQRDQRALRRLFSIPKSAKIERYEGYPDRVGFGQREGLEIRASYLLSGPDLDTVLQQLNRSDWEPLPIPAQIQRTLWPRAENMPLKATRGYFFCAHAGDNVLYARETRSCSRVQNPNDLILGILDTEARSLHVLVASDY
ncbi:hypothetical protein [Lyngbya confervoides]|uniref:Lipoprotein n=1 Tax=Lyngbya confervoides BDU141951 TaxID=1574623 RepID=A0ABD4T395_9CYAN|nr:hypothetical protein [Lyngbya confervoides]MCM1983256.1 hypothetical protein [Lyngbya confervoides BDU141951]